MARENKTKIIGFRDTEDFKIKLEQIADKNNMNLSEFIRYCVNETIIKQEVYKNGRKNM